jgi:dTDP-4-amino-4,6-dideoxygalactose transaminase
MDALELKLGQAETNGVLPKIVVPVHLAGQCVDMAALSDVAKEAGLQIVTDAAHAIGSVCNDSPVGACQHEELTTFSFHPVKTIAMGEGGAVTTNDAGYAERMRRLRSHGMERRDDVTPWMYDMTEIGFNYRVTDFQCALGLSQLKKIDRFVNRRQELVDRYDRLLAPLSSVILSPKKVSGCRPAWHLYAVRIDFQELGMTRAEVMNALKKKGIGTQVHYIPVHTQPYYRSRYGDLSLFGAQQYYEKTLSLPLFPAMKDEDVDIVVDALEEVTKGRSNGQYAAKTGVVR